MKPFNKTGNASLIKWLFDFENSVNSKIKLIAVFNLNTAFSPGRFKHQLWYLHINKSRDYFL